MKKKKMLMKIVTFVMGMARVAASNGTSWLLGVGEPTLPRKLDKSNTIVVT